VIEPGLKSVARSSRTSSGVFELMCFSDRQTASTFTKTDPGRTASRAAIRENMLNRLDYQPFTNYTCSRAGSMATRLRTASSLPDSVTGQTESTRAITSSYRPDAGSVIQ